MVRHACNQADEMRVMNMQVDGRAAGIRGIADLRGPVWLRDHALEMPAEQLTVLPAADRLGGVRELRKERQHMRDHE